MFRGLLAAAQTGFKIFKFNFKVKTVGSPPTRAQRRFKRTSFGTLRFFNCALSLNRNGRVSGISVTAAKCRRLGGAFAAGFEPKVSNRLLSAIFECGLGIFKDKHCVGFDFRKAQAASKTTSRERRKTAWFFTRVEARTERTAQRRSLRL